MIYEAGRNGIGNGTEERYLGSDVGQQKAQSPFYQPPYAVAEMWRGVDMVRLPLRTKPHDIIMKDASHLGLKMTHLYINSFFFFLNLSLMKSLAIKERYTNKQRQTQSTNKTRKEQTQ